VARFEYTTNIYIEKEIKTMGSGWTSPELMNPSEMGNILYLRCPVMTRKDRKWYSKNSSWRLFGNPYDPALLELLNNLNIVAKFTPRKAY
jgi:hypothetical protein